MVAASTLLGAWTSAPPFASGLTELVLQAGPAKPSEPVKKEAAKVAEPAKPAAPAKAPEPARTPEPKVDPAALFTKLGCPLCHAPGARYHEKILVAPTKAEQDLARWIRNPEKFLPGTAMPTYASMIDEPTSIVLARWLREGGPGAPTEGLKKK